MTFSDYEAYEPSENVLSGFFVSNVLDDEGEIIGVLAFQSGLGKVDEIMQTKIPLGDRAETYLVGPDLTLRSTPVLDESLSVLLTRIDTTLTRDWKRRIEAGPQHTAKKIGAQVYIGPHGQEVIGRYEPLDIQGVSFAVIEEIETGEALAAATRLRDLVFGLLAVTVVLVIIMAVVISRRIVRPVLQLSTGARRVAEGQLDQSISVGTKNEIGALSEDFNKMITGLREARSQADRSSWLREGQAQLNEAVRGEQDIERFSEKLVTCLAHYLDCAIGAVYVNNGSERFELVASYAYKQRKNLSSVFSLGEGLVGQAARERTSILLDQVPDDYVRVTSGLGDAVPRQIFVTPLVNDDDVVAVLELGTLRTFDEQAAGLIESIGEGMAVALQVLKARGALEESLAVTQRQAEQLEGQREHLETYNAELEEQTQRLQRSEQQLQAQQDELKASNEELEEQTQLLQRSEDKLRSQQEELQVTNEELEEKNEALGRQKREVEVANVDLERTRKEIAVKAEELAITSKYKSEFLANMSHELRTPLNSLLLLARSLAENKEGNLTEDQVQSAEIVYGSGSDLLSLINEILDLARIEAGRMELNVEDVALQSLVETMRGKFQHMAEDKGLRLEISVDESAPQNIRTDGQRLGQIIKNLLGNAIKFTAEGVVDVRLGRPGPDVDLSRSGLEPEHALMIAVKDTGIGVPWDKQKVIFEAFQQASSGTARQFGGTGLGLSISRELAHLLGGEIQLKSEEGHGSTFALFVPESYNGTRTPSPETGRISGSPPLRRDRRAVATVAGEAPRVSPGLERTPDDRDKISDGDRCILVIEDDAKFAAILVKQCRSKGFKCLAAPSGEEGLDLAHAHEPVAIILDLNLPGIDGWKVLQALKDEPATRHIPVHIMSAEEASIDAYKRGAIGHLTKPATTESLEEAFGKLEDMFSRKMKTLLVVEDDEGSRKGIVKLIGNGDVVCDEAATAAEAIRAFESTRYDCMILDIGLPDMSGFELLEILEGMEGVVMPPVVVYTGRELSREESTILEHHAESIIVKGVKSEDRLLDEASLFLHRMVAALPKKKQRIIKDLYDTDALLRGKRVLIVDDDMRNVFALSRLLEENGMVALKAENGEKALVVLGQEEVDIILMDVMMPVMDGYETTRRIRSLDTKDRDIPIIALTAKAMKRDRELCIEAGANDYLSKPVDVDRLCSMMRVWLYR